MKKIEVDSIKDTFHGKKKEREREEGRERKRKKKRRERGGPTDRMLQLVEKIKAHGILMDRGTRSFTLDQFSRIRRFSRDKRCIKPCAYTGRASGVLHTGREVSKNATNLRERSDDEFVVPCITRDARVILSSIGLLNLFHLVSTI